MSTIPAFDSGLQSIQKGMNGLKKNAFEIANTKNGLTQTPEIKPLTEPLIEIKMNTLQVEMGVKVLQASSGMMGSLLDIKV